MRPPCARHNATAGRTHAHSAGHRCLAAAGQWGGADPPNHAGPSHLDGPYRTGDYATRFPHHDLPNLPQHPVGVVAGTRRGQTACGLPARSDPYRHGRPLRPCSAPLLSAPPAAVHNLFSHPVPRIHPAARAHSAALDIRLSALVSQRGRAHAGTHTHPARPLASTGFSESPRVVTRRRSGGVQPDRSHRLRQRIRTAAPDRHLHGAGRGGKKHRGLFAAAGRPPQGGHW